MKTTVLSIFILLVGSITAAYADCTYDGNTYTTGTKVGPLVCQPDGTWKPE